MPDHFASSLTLARTEGLGGNKFPTFDSSTHSIIAVASARIYHSHLNAKDSDWVYSRLKGTLRFGRDWNSGGPGGIKTNDEAEQHWFTLVDEQLGKPVWMFKIPIGFRYEVDRPFFHVFQGRTRKYGFLFEDDDEANLFSKKVISQTCKDPLSKRTRSLRAKPLNSSLGHVRSRSLTTSPISGSMISSPAPNSFKHVAHVGVNKEGVFEASKGLDPVFKEMLTKLQNFGVSENVVLENMDFVEGFWKGVDAARTSTTGDEMIGLPRAL